MCRCPVPWLFIQVSDTLDEITYCSAPLLLESLNFPCANSPKRDTLTVAHTDVSTTAVSDQAFIPASRRSINKTNAPTICTSPRINRTTARARLPLAGVGEGGYTSGIGPPVVFIRHFRSQPPRRPLASACGRKDVEGAVASERGPSPLRPRVVALRQTPPHRQGESPQRCCWPHGQS